MSCLLRFSLHLCITILIGGVFSPTLTHAQIAQEVITTGAEGARSVLAVDLDSDGDKDVLAASLIGDKIAWYENLGTGEFSDQNVITTSAEGPRSISVADFDADGDQDVVAALANDNTVAWYENTGGSFSPNIISFNATDANSVATADIDGDGDPDLLASPRSDDKIVWYENDGGSFVAEHVVTSDTQGGVREVFAADLDGDQDPDVLSAAFRRGTVDWYENEDGSGSFSNRNEIMSSIPVESVYAADLDGDGDKDVVSASSESVDDGADNKIAWYENTGGSFSEQNVLTTDADGAFSVYAADLDADGDKDVLSASFEDDKVAWYKNLDSGFSGQHIITTSADGAASVFAADLNGDSDQDVLSASTNDNKVAWYENTDDVLPVELNGLSVRANGTAARLTWQTASETRSAGFEVQRQKESSWRQVGYVESKAAGGTTTETQSYSFAAKDLPVGTHQFRLKQVDLDGSSTLIDPVSVDIQMQEAMKLTAPAPNPASTSANLSFAVKEQSETTITLYNTLGQQVATVYEGTPQAGERQRAQVDVSGLSSGTYFLCLQADGKTATERVTVVR